jgi:hypothetical protein
MSELKRLIVEADNRVKFLSVDCKGIEADVNSEKKFLEAKANLAYLNTL